MSDGSFRSVDSALRFAFSITEHAIISNPQLLPGNSRRDGSMTAHDWHAQGALIKSYIESKLSRNAAAYIYAFYGRGAEKKVALRRLLEIPAIAATGERKTVAAVVARYTASGKDKRTLRQIASDLGVHSSTVFRAEAKVKEVITKLFAEADAQMVYDFKRSGLVE